MGSLVTDCSRSSDTTGSSLARLRPAKRNGYRGAMPGHLWTYRFTDADGGEIEKAELADDAAAEARGRDLSKSGNVAVRVERHSAHVDAWEYVTEADERE
jgi:hypothetical protein